MLRSDMRRLMRAHLSPEQEQVLTLRFGLSDDHPRTVRQVGEAMGDLPMRQTKHLLFSALNKMRKPHVARALRDYLTSAEEEGA